MEHCIRHLGYAIILYMISGTFYTILQFVHTAFQFYYVMLFIRILGSWIPELQCSQFMQIVARFTDPYLNFFRSIIPPLGMIDLSPLAVFFSLRLLENYVVLPFLITFFSH